MHTENRMIHYLHKYYKLYIYIYIYILNLNIQLYLYKKKFRNITIALSKTP